jgi:hypothetical protein
MEPERKRKISADLPPDLGDGENEVIGPMPFQAGKPEAKKRKGEVNIRVKL